MARGSRGPAKYPRSQPELPHYLYARLQAASTVLGMSVPELIESAVDGRLAELDEVKRELIDRIASETLVRTQSD